MTTDRRCRVCHRAASESYQLSVESPPVSLCATHKTLISSTVDLIRSTEVESRALGFGVALDSVESDGTAPLKCQKCGALWSGLPGSLCGWCLVRHVDLLAEQRELVLADCQYDPDDQRYKAEIIRRGQQLVNAVSIGLVSQLEAQQVFDRWASHV